MPGRHVRGGPVLKKQLGAVGLQGTRERDYDILAGKVMEFHPIMQVTYGQDICSLCLNLMLSHATYAFPFDTHSDTSIT